MSKYKNIHFLLMYPLNTAPGQRFRFEQYFPLLEKCGLEYSTNCFYDKKSYGLVVQKKNKLVLILRLMLCYLKHIKHLFFLRKYDCFLIQRGAAPFGPPLCEWVLHYLYRKPIIYDFDDAIWQGPTKEPSWFIRWIKSRNKIGKICKWSDVVVVGNQYLADYALRFNPQVSIIPTVVNTDGQAFTSVAENERIIVGWTGSHSTLMYVEALQEVLSRLKKKLEFDVMIMANAKPKFVGLEHYFIQWSEKAEVEELPKIDIGIMPLPNDEWTKGKCGLKAIQYMALGRPAIVSAVGVNSEIVDHGVNGFVCYTDEDWEKYLELLISDRILCKKMGMSAYKKIENFYSTKKGSLLWREVL